MLATKAPERTVGRYLLGPELASGGMATVHLGRLLGAAGFTRVVAIKRLHPAIARDPELAPMLVDEARLAARIRHPNVVQTLDVVAEDKELFLVMEYIDGESVESLLRDAAARGRLLDIRVVAAIAVGVLYGLHAAHEARSEAGASLDIVHRDVSPQNIMVATDGVPRLADFGIAKAASRTHVTLGGCVKGKLNYMAPEQVEGEPVDRRADVFAIGVVLWEMLTLRRLFTVTEEDGLSGRLRPPPLVAPSRVAPVTARLDAIVAKALAARPRDRFATAREMALAIESAVAVGSSREVAELVERSARRSLAARRSLVSAFEGAPVASAPAPRAPWPSAALALTRQRPATAPAPPPSESDLARYVLSDDAPPSSPPAAPRGTSSFVAVRPTVRATLLSARTAADWLVVRRPAPALLAFMLLASGVLALMAVQLRRNEAPARALAASPPAPFVRTEEPRTPPVLLDSPPPPPPVLDVPPPPATAPASAPPPPAPAARGRVLVRPSAPDCSPPWFVDSDGIRRIKPLCR